MITKAVLALLLAQFNNPAGKVDPLWVADSPAGPRMMDALIGPETRIVCVFEQGPIKRCPPGEAVRVDGVPRFGQFMAEWDKSDPRLVNVYVFGGHVVTCETVNQVTGVRVTLRRLPILEMRDPEGWNPATTARFAHVPDSCGGPPT